MAASVSMMPETRKMTSICSPDVDRCSHTFEIHQYSLQEGIGIGRALRSSIFAVGGYKWRISYYPDGQRSIGYASVYLDFMSKETCPEGTKVRAHACFHPFNPATSELGLRLNVTIKHTVLDPNQGIAWGSSTFINRRLLASYLCNDRLTIVCNLSVVVGSRVSGPESETTCENQIIEVPPSNLSENLGKLLDTKEGTDVTFKVKGEVFHAHKAVLAGRSQVFKAELYGLVGERKTRNGHITIQEMEPGVFKALLHFIYTDSLPAANYNDGCDLDDEGVVKHLLLAADRYAMDRMKLMCESMLCKRLDVENVAATLALADRHYCTKLKDACISFMRSRKRIKYVMGTQGYEHLKKARPSIVMDLLEESIKSSVS